VTTESLAPNSLSTLSQKSETVSQKSDCGRKRRDNGDSLTFLRQCGQTLNDVVDRGSGVAG